MWSRLFTGSADWHLLVAALIPTLLLAWLAGRGARMAMAHVMKSVLEEGFVPSSGYVRGPLRAVELAAFALVFAALIFPAFEAAGLHPRAGLHLRTVNEWAFDNGLRSVLIAVGAFALIRTVTVAVKNFETEVRFGTDLDALERAKRARTLGSVLTNITTIVVTAVASLMVLRELGVDTSPALTGAGIIGVALGFGAQNLVKDIIGGFFLILENQIRVGDVVAINGTGGLVESINLRTTVLRDEEGTVFIFPNGGITTLANRSMHFSYYVVNLPLAYGVDTDKATAVVKELADEMQKDDRYAPFILAPLEVIGVDAFEQTAVRLKVRIKTAPLKQWDVGRELRRRIYQTFGERHIELWSPQKSMTVPPPSG